jgi:hypothetical protein
MDLEHLAESAEHEVQEHGGVSGVMHTAEQLEHVASGNGSIIQKATEAASALKQTSGEGEHRDGEHREGEYRREEDEHRR